MSSPISAIRPAGARNRIGRGRATVFRCLMSSLIEAVRLILDCPGAVLTSGIGKAGHVARKLSASFSSTGTPSHFLNPAEALHGDLGSVRKGDVVLILSYSGESDEILRMLSVVKQVGNPVIAMTSTSIPARWARLPTSC